MHKLHLETWSSFSFLSPIVGYELSPPSLRGTVLLRGVMWLDGARGKKQVWGLHVRTWGLSEANVLCWRKYLRHWWEFSASTHWFDARGIVPPLSSLATPLVLLLTRLVMRFRHCSKLISLWIAKTVAKASAQHISIPVQHILWIYEICLACEKWGPLFETRFKRFLN